MQKNYQHIFYFGSILYHSVHNLLRSHNHSVPEFSSGTLSTTYSGVLLPISSGILLTISYAILSITPAEVTPIALFCFFLFHGFLSLEPIDLPRFLCIVTSAGVISIRTSAFKASICDLVTLFVSVNASGNSFSILYKCIIF
jgi:hypothetical protein